MNVDMYQYVLYIFICRCRWFSFCTLFCWLVVTFVRNATCGWCSQFFCLLFRLFSLCLTVCVFLHSSFPSLCAVFSLYLLFLDTISSSNSTISCATEWSSHEVSLFFFKYNISSFSYNINRANHKQFIAFLADEIQNRRCHSTRKSSVIIKSSSCNFFFDFKMFINWASEII